MSKQKNIFSSLLLGTFMLARADISVAEDVYVDLSVLDTLENSDSAISGQPLFPMVSASKTHKDKPRSVKKKQPVSKPVKKVLKGPVLIRDKTADIEIPKKAEIKVEELNPVKVIHEDKALTSEAAQVENQPVKPGALEIIKANFPDEDEAPLPVQENNIPAEAVATPLPQSFGSENHVEVQPAVNKPIEAPAADTQMHQAVGTPADVELMNVETSAPQPLIQPQAPVVSPSMVSNATPSNNNIVFADTVSELSNADMQKIDNIINKFDNIANNKIAIYAYNYDDGQDVFRKKRLSLSRAVEIRSYLLGKGHKNFSIKVINVTEADKNNLVIVEELK